MPQKGHCLVQSPLGSCSLTCSSARYITGTTFQRLFNCHKTPKTEPEALITTCVCYLWCYTVLVLHCTALLNLLSYRGAHVLMFSTFSVEPPTTCRATTGFMAKAVKVQRPPVQLGTQIQGSRTPGHRSLTVRCICKTKLMLVYKGYVYISHTSLLFKWQDKS